MTCHTCYITVQNVLILSTTPENECDSLDITLVAQVHNISFLISIYTICTCLKKKNDRQQFVTHQTIPTPMSTTTLEPHKQPNMHTTYSTGYKTTCNQGQTTSQRTSGSTHHAVSSDSSLCRQSTDSPVG